MLRKLIALSLALAAGILVACGGRAGSGMAPSGGTAMLPSLEGGDVAVIANLPKHAIGEDLPTVLGTVYVKGIKADVGGFTQTHWSQTLAYPPGTTITIWNLSKTVTHTFNVVMKVTTPPAVFPAHPKLSFTKHGGDVLGTGFASGPLKPGAWITVKLSKPGTYLIGCAYHYTYGMRDMIRVAKGAVPGPQATPPAKSSPTPMPTNSGGGGGW